MNNNLKKITNVFVDTKEQTLIILDDFANLHDAKVKSLLFTKLAFYGRHSNISRWAITQKYNAIVKDFRQNIQALVLFYDKDKKSRKAAFKENDVGITSAEKNDIVKHLKTHKNFKFILRFTQPFWHVLR